MRAPQRKGSLIFTDCSGGKIYELPASSSRLESRDSLGERAGRKIQAPGFRDVDSRAFLFACHHFCETTIVEREGIIRVELNRFIVIRQSLFDVPLVR